MSIEEIISTAVVVVVAILVTVAIVSASKISVEVEEKAYKEGSRVLDLSFLMEKCFGKQINLTFLEKCVKDLEEPVRIIVNNTFTGEEYVFASLEYDVEEVEHREKIIYPVIEDDNIYPATVWIEYLKPAEGSFMVGP